MRGIPANPVDCTVPGCDRPGYPKIGRCNKHRPPNARLKYPWTDQQVSDLRRFYEQNVYNKRELSRAINSFAKRHSFPPHIVKQKAGYLRLTADIRKFWTEEELEFVRENVGQIRPKDIAKKLGRGYLSVINMINHLGLIGRVTEGYSRNDLSLVFGVSLFVVRQWFQRGLMHPDTLTDRVPEDQVRDFISAYPEEYSLKRMDEAWFKGMLFPLFGRRITSLKGSDPKQSSQNNRRSA